MGVSGGKNHIADHGQLGSAAHAVTMHSSNRDLFCAHYAADDGVKLDQHLADLIRSVRGHIYPSRKMLLIATKQDG